MIFLRVEAVPTQVVVDREGTIGAYVNCWIAADEPLDAERKAREWIREAGWNVVRVEECFPLRSDQRPEPEEAERIEEALEHGASLTFHTWRTGGEPTVG